MSLGEELRGERLGVTADAARIRVRVRGDDPYSHGADRSAGPRCATIFVNERAPQLRQVHLHPGAARVAPAQRRGAGLGQARVRRGARRVRRGPPAPHLLPGRDARRLRPHGAGGRARPRPHPRAARAAQPERPDALGRDRALVPGHDQGVRVLGGGHPAGAASRLRRPLPHRLPHVEEARVVRPGARGADAGDARAHRDRQALHRHRHQHRLLVRPRRPGVRGLLQRRRARRVPRPRAGAALDRVERLHRVRDADLHLHLGLSREGAGRARRGDQGGRAPGVS